MTPFPASDLLVGGVFALCVTTTVGGALLAVLSARIIRSVCGLALCCVGIAGLYHFLQSPFLALMEILIYVGAVCVTIVFAIMLAEPGDLNERENRGAGAGWAAGALLVSALLLWGVSRLGLQAGWTEPAARTTDGSVKAIGVALLTTYSLAFELISLVLLVAIMGALAIARAGRTKL